MKSLTNVCEHTREKSKVLLENFGNFDLKFSEKRQNIQKIDEKTTKNKEKSFFFLEQEEISFEDKENLSFCLKSPKKTQKSEKTEKKAVLKRKIDERLEKEGLKAKKKANNVYK